MTSKLWQQWMVFDSRRIGLFFCQLQANSDADSVECRNLINRHIYTDHILLRVIWPQRSISRNHYTATRSNVTSGTMKTLFRCADRHFWSLFINLTSSSFRSGSPASVSWWLYVWKSWSRLLPAYILLLSRAISLTQTLSALLCSLPFSSQALPSHVDLILSTITDHTESVGKDDLFLWC